MAFKRKSSSKKIYLAIVLLIVLIAASAAIVYYSQSSSVKATAVGVHVGDTFTYSIQGQSILIGLDAVEPPGFSVYNQTDYYKVTVADVNGTTVTMATVWRFTNGTEVNGQQTLNLANGVETQQNGFWALYSAGLSKNDIIHPVANPLNGIKDGLKVNSTDTKTYADSTRTRNIWSLQNEFVDTTDPTLSTYRSEYTTVYFDSQTGMLDTLSNVQQYNNPQMNIIVTWQLTSCSLWNV
jgi:hypothetical protein